MLKIFLTEGSEVGPPCHNSRILWCRILRYRKNKHTSGGGEGQNVDWAQYYWWARNEPELPIIEVRPYDYAQYYIYMG
jgi:hypothetical protein